MAYAIQAQTINSVKFAKEERTKKVKFGQEKEEGKI